MSRSSGRSATAAAAYRSGTEITDKTTGEIHDYRNKGTRGDGYRGVEESRIILPKDAPTEFNDRETLWNAVEDSENRCNSVVAREVLVAIPHELNQEQRSELVNNYAQSLSDRYQTGVDYSIHAPAEKGDDRNYHAHIMMTTRRIDENGLGEKTRELDAYKSTGIMEINNIRQTWEEQANKSLEKAGKEERIDSRSLKDQGIDREPTQHVGVAGTAIDRRGEFSERAEINKEIKSLNNERIQTLKELKTIHAEQRELKSEISTLRTANKEVSKELNKAERLDKAVDSARNKAEFSHEKANNNYKKYEGWHDRQIQDASKDLKATFDNEPQKNFWQTQGSHEKQRSEWREKVDTGYKEIFKTIDKHSPPLKSEAIDRASGKAAYEHKISKSEIKENYNTNDHKTNLDSLEQKKVEIQNKLNERIENRDTNVEQISDRSEKIDNLKERIAERKQELESNSEKIRGTETKELNEVRPGNEPTSQLNASESKAQTETVKSPESNTQIESGQDRTPENQAQSAKIKQNIETRQSQPEPPKSAETKTQAEPSVKVSDSSKVDTKQTSPEQQAKVKQVKERLEAKQSQSEPAKSTKVKTQTEPSVKVSDSSKSEVKQHKSEQKRTPEQQAQADRIKERLETKQAQTVKSSDTKTQAESKEKISDSSKTEVQQHKPEQKRTPEQQAQADKIKERLDAKKSETKDKTQEQSKSSSKDDGLGY